jgi:UDP-glucose 4-epimerase
MKYLITGGAGFIGSHLVDELTKSENQITILDTLSTGSKSNLTVSPRIEFINGDIRDSVLVDKLIANCDVVIHLAAALGVDNILKSTLESLSINILGSEIVLQAAAKYSRRTVIASTSEIYGKNTVQPLTENSDRVVGKPQNIRWTYSDAKAIEEAIAQVLFQERSLPVTTLRFFNTVGPRQTGRYGMVLPRFVKAAVNGSKIEVYGDGSQSRVFCHVLDAVNAINGVISNDKTIGEVFNVGGVGEISILGLANKVKEITNSDSKIVTKSYDEAYASGFEDMQRRVPSIEKINLAIGWRPLRKLEEIIGDVEMFFRSNAELS